jgi:hypothetical protein
MKNKEVEDNHTLVNIYKEESKFIISKFIFRRKKKYSFFYYLN